MRDTVTALSLGDFALNYDVVETVTTMNAALGIQKNIQKQLEETIQSQIRRAEKGKIGAFDAIMTSDGDNVTLIKWK